MQMKKIFLVFFLAGLFGQYAGAQVTIQSGIPAVGMMQKSQLWNLQLTNNSRTSYDCRLELVLRDRVNGQEVMTAASGIFVLQAGVKQVRENTVAPVQYNYFSQGANNRLNGLLPAGAYTICYSVTAIGVKEITLAEECVSFDVEPLSPPMLIFPADSSVLDNAPSQFSWIPPSPAGMFDKLHYSFVITEIKPGQVAAEAIQENLPVFSDGYVMNNSTSYSAAANKLEKDKWYAWQVIALDDKEYAAKTETWVFTIRENQVEKIIKGTPFVKLKTESPDMAVAPEGWLKIAYENRYGDSTTLITVTELSGEQQSKPVAFTVTLAPGENLIQYPLKKIMHISEDKTWQAVLKNSRGEKWVVLFRIKLFNK